jgi:hypothetical protein
MQDEGVLPEVVLTAVPAGLVEPDNEGAATALASGSAFPALWPADAAAAAKVVRASLQATVAASPRAAAAGAGLASMRAALLRLWRMVYRLGHLFCVAGCSEAG